MIVVTIFSNYYFFAYATWNVNSNKWHVFLRCNIWSWIIFTNRNDWFIMYFNFKRSIN